MTGKYVVMVRMWVKQTRPNSNEFEMSLEEARGLTDKLMKHKIDRKDIDIVKASETKLKEKQELYGYPSRRIG